MFSSQPWLRRPFAWMRERIRAYRQPFFIYRGLAAESGLPLMLLYAGTLHEHKHWLLRLVFGTVEIEPAQQGVTWSWQVLRKAKRLAPDLALAFIESAPGVPHGLPATHFKLPFWAEVEMDISGEGLAHCRERMGKIRSKINQHKLTCRVSQREEDFDTFYHELYVPHIRGMQGPAARIGRYEVLKKDMAHSELLFVQHDQRDVAGVMLQFVDGHALAVCHGIRPGDPQLIKMSVFSAAMYFAILAIHEKGFPRMNFGGSRPLLTDGALHFKKLFGAYFIPKQHTREEYAHLCPLQATPAVRAWLRAHPWMFITPAGALDWLVFATADDLAELPSFCTRLSTWKMAGLNTLHLYMFDNPPDTEMLTALRNAAGTLQVHSAAEIFG